MTCGHGHFETVQRDALDREPAPSPRLDILWVADEVLDRDGNAARRARRDHAAGASTRVLVIEDEALISLDLCDTLVDAGYQVVGPATTLAGALFMLRQQPAPHLAIVDVKLRDGACTEVARQLRRRGVPFFIHSGYGRHACSIEGFEGAAWLAKPAAPREILKLLGQLAAPEGG